MAAQSCGVNAKFLETAPRDLLCLPPGSYQPWPPLVHARAHAHTHARTHTRGCLIAQCCPQLASPENRLCQPMGSANPVCTLLSYLPEVWAGSLKSREISRKPGPPPHPALSRSRGPPDATFVSLPGISQLAHPQLASILYLRGYLSNYTPVHTQLPVRRE